MLYLYVAVVAATVVIVVVVVAAIAVVVAIVAIVVLVVAVVEVNLEAKLPTVWTNDGTWKSSQEKIQTWGKSERRKSAYTTLAVKACLLGGYSYTKSSITFVNIAVAISALAGEGAKNGFAPRPQFSTKSKSWWCCRLFSTVFGRRS